MLGLLKITPRAIRLGLPGKELDEYSILGVRTKFGGDDEEYDGCDLGYVWECVCGYQGGERFDEFGWAEMAAGGDNSGWDGGRRRCDDGADDDDDLRGRNHDWKYMDVSLRGPHWRGYHPRSSLFAFYLRRQASSILSAFSLACGRYLDLEL